MPSGGKRPGAGRKKKADANPRPVAAAEKRCADRLPASLSNLEALADGKVYEYEQRWEAAGAFTIKVTRVDDKGDPIYDPKGKPVLISKLAFPDLPPEQLVLVGRKRKRLGKDRQANEYLTDRAMGRPRQSVEVEGKDGGPVQLQVQFYMPTNERDKDVPAPAGAARAVVEQPG